jgi:hypothetical protein
VCVQLASIGLLGRGLELMGSFTLGAEAEAEAESEGEFSPEQKNVFGTPTSALISALICSVLRFTPCTHLCLVCLQVANWCVAR